MLQNSDTLYLTHFNCLIVAHERCLGKQCWPRSFKGCLGSEENIPQSSLRWQIDSSNLKGVVNRSNCAFLFITFFWAGTWFRQVWSEFSVSAWLRVGSSATHKAHSEDSDQTAWRHRLVWVFDRCTCNIISLCCFLAHLVLWKLYNIHASLQRIYINCNFHDPWLFFKMFPLVKTDANKCFKIVNMLLTFIFLNIKVGKFKLLGCHTYYTTKPCNFRLLEGIHQCLFHINTLDEGVMM